MARHRKRRTFVSPIFGFGISWFFLAMFLPMYRLWAILLTAGICSFVAYLLGLNAARKADAKDKAAEAKAESAVKQAQKKQPRKPVTRSPSVVPLLKAQKISPAR